MTTVSGVRRFEASRERVFALLVDPHVIAAALPAVRDVRIEDADHWEAKVKPSLPLAPSISIRFEVQARRPPEHADLRAHGGGADVRSTFDLEEEGDATLMHWRTELELTGILGRLAGPGLEPVAQRQAERTLDEVTRRL